MIAFKIILATWFVALANSASAPETVEQVMRVGSFELPCTADTAFPLFSPEGERDWVKGWAPTPVFPERIEFARDTVFREGKGSEEAVWIIVDADWKTHRAEYVRSAPHSHTAHIVVKIESLATERSKLVVSYTVTAFGEHAAEISKKFSEEAYAAKMRDWQQHIVAYLEGRKSL